MASPTVVSRSTPSAETGNTTSHTVNLPGSISAGNLIVVFFSYTAIPTTVDWATAGFTAITGFKTEGNGHGIDAGYKVATGSEGTTITVGTDTSLRSCHTAYQISGGDTPYCTTGTTGEGPAHGADPPNVNVVNGPKDILVLASAAIEGETFTGFGAPSNYTNLLTQDTGTTGSVAANGMHLTAERSLTAASSENPGNFSHNHSDGWVAQTVIVNEAAGASPQNLTGTLFTKAPTFSTGAITSVRNLAGSLFTKAPTFSTGVITATRNLAGVLFQKAPSFFGGSFTAGAVNLSGTLFTKAPTFFAGAVIESQAVAGVLFTKSPTFSQGVITIGAAPLDGVLFQRAPTFFSGTITATRNLSGALFVSSPAFPQGTVTPGEAALDGVLYQNAPDFNPGTLTQEGGPQLLGGVLFTKAPTFPQGTISAGAVGLTGVLFQKAPTFSVGSIATTYNLAGVLYQNAPFFSQGEVIGAQLVEGVPFSNTPLFPAGSIGVAGAIDGVLFQKAPTFFVGAMGQLGGSFWRPNPAGYTLNPVAFDPVLRDEVPPWAIEVDGEEFELAPAFFAGSLS